MSTELEAYEGGVFVGAVCAWAMTYNPDAEVAALAEALLSVASREFDDVFAVVRKTTSAHYNDLQQYGLAKALRTVKVVCA